MKIQTRAGTLETDNIVAASPYRDGLILYLTGAHRIQVKKNEPAYEAVKDWAPEE